MTSLKRSPVMKNKAKEGSAVDKVAHISTQDMAEWWFPPTTFEEDLAHAKWMHNLFRAAIEKDKKKHYICSLCRVIRSHLVSIEDQTEK